MHLRRDIVILAVLSLLAACSAGAPAAGPVASGVSDGAPAPAATPSSSATSPSGVEDTLPRGSSTQNVLVDGTSRTFRTYRPATARGAAPLVLVFHGYGGSAALAESTYGWDATADREGFVVAYLQGLDASFNAGGCCGEAAARGIDDVGAAVAVAEQVARTTPIDLNRQYVTGFSNGGAMTYRVACETDRFAAFGPVSGGQVVDCADHAPTSILHIHGDADSVVPITGDAAGMGHPAVADTLAGWRERQGCGQPTQSTQDGVRRSLSSCPAGRDIDLLVVGGLSHTWPDTSTGVSGSDTLWTFFAAHRR